MRLDHDRVAEAVRYAAEQHADQTRKGGDVPYLSHLLAVASLVLEDGGDEDQVIAGLLHDVAEDQGGEQRLTEVRALFGERVERIVRACSDSLVEDPDAKEDWQLRKERAIGALADAPEFALTVVAADKLHNLRSTALDLDLRGDDVWTIFRTGREGFLWYNEQLHDLLKRRIPASRSVAALDLELAGLSAKLGVPQ
jgi:(p)ppGpp synthase/HD superfamily hydrolase